MSIIKRIRKEFLDEHGIAIVSLRTSFLGIPIFEDSVQSTSNVILSQFGNIDTSQIKETTGLYDVTKIGFKQE